jgi:EAP30/Vps36 family
MCSVDPLASKKGFWSEVLGVGDFYYELSVQITEGNTCKITNISSAHVHIHTASTTVSSCIVQHTWCSMH